MQNPVLHPGDASDPVQHPGGKFDLYSDIIFIPYLLEVHFKVSQEAAPHITSLGPQDCVSIMFAAIKAFAREVCRNDLLNFGRLHFFFPDSRLALNLNTDKTLKVRRTSSLQHIVCAQPVLSNLVI